MKIKKGDKVTVISGASRGKSGAVLVAFPKQNSVLVEGVNMKKRHERPRKQNQKGQIVERPFPINVSNVKKV
jgi:large subunit ribosomal protein L24